MSGATTFSGTTTSRISGLSRTVARARTSTCGAVRHAAVTNSTPTAAKGSTWIHSTRASRHEVAAEELTVSRQQLKPVQCRAPCRSPSSSPAPLSDGETIGARWFRWDS